MELTVNYMTPAINSNGLYMPCIPLLSPFISYKKIAIHDQCPPPFCPSAYCFDYAARFKQIKACKHCCIFDVSFFDVPFYARFFKENKKLFFSDVLQNLQVKEKS